MLLSAIILGIAGSFHCAGMCSPLAFAITSMKASALTNRLLYNFGRITTYGILGAITASIGYLLPLSKYQNVLSILFGSVLIAIAITGVVNVHIPIVTPMMVRFTGVIKKLFSKFLSRKSQGALVLLGALNGLLPCGLTFMALTFCVTLTTPLDGFIYMLVFGIGTLPVMLGLISVVAFIKTKLNWNIKRVAAGLIMLSGILLIVRVFLVHIPAHESSNAVDIVICR